MIDIETFNQLKPVFRQVLNGTVLGDGHEPEENIPYQVKVNTISPLAINPDNNEDGQSSPEDGEAVPVVNVVPLKGVMFKNDQECGPKGTRTIGNRLLSADADPLVLGHIIVIDSPGGTVEAVEEILPVFSQLTKPVVGFIDGMMCSAALYVGCNCKEIIANLPTYKVGSIGTMANFTGRKSKSEANSYGDLEVSIYADASTEKNADYHKAIDDFDFKPVKKKLNKLNDRFVATVKTQRPNADDTQLHGSVYEAAEVLGSLVDSIGSFDDAVQKVVDLSNLNKTTAPTEENNSQNLNTITMDQFNSINNVLGVDQLEGDEQGVYLNEEQLGALEATLNANASALAETERQLTASQQAATAAEEARAAAETAQQAAESEVSAVLTAMNSIGPTVANAADATAKAAAVKAIVAAKISQSPTGALKTDPAPVEKESDGWSNSQQEMVNNL
jgi:protease-4